MTGYFQPMKTLEIIMLFVGFGAAFLTVRLLTNAVLSVFPAG